ncbi:MAG: magnesium transporter CorA family protein [Chloroflexota bacterium]
MSESRFYQVTPQGKLNRMATLAEVFATAQQGGYVWLDYYQPTKAELSLLIAPLKLHPLSIEDCVDDNQLPKIDDYPENAFIIFNAFNYAEGALTLNEVDIFIGAGFLVTVTSSSAENHQLLRSIESAVELDPTSISQGPAFLLHVLLDNIVDRKFVAIERLEEQLDTAEEAILSGLADFKPATLLHLRRDLLALRKGLFHEREILVKICRKDCPFIPEAALFQYRDIYDHLTKFFELTETSRDILTSLMEMYLSMLNNQMSRTANQTNMTVRRLTFITTIFMPLSLLAGIGGMSEWSMMTGPENWRITYPAFLLAMVVLGFISYHLLQRLEKKDRDVDPPGMEKGQ